MSMLENDFPERDPNRIFYATLAGGNAEDIKLMRDRGMLGAAPNGAIPDEDEKTVVVIESGLNNVAKVRRDWPGLNVIHSTVQSLVGGAEDPVSFPHRKNRAAVSARFINLDFNSSLSLDFVNGAFAHPQLEIVRKLAGIQRAQNGASPWTLFLTLQGEIRWTSATQVQVLSYLNDNRVESTAFKEVSDRYLSQPTRQLVETGLGSNDLEHLPRPDQQRLICTLVPKRIALAAATLGWRVHTRANWQYGGANGAAPMCTWIFEFEYDTRSDRNPNAVYLDSLATILDEGGVIKDDGSFSEA